MSVSNADEMNFYNHMIRQDFNIQQEFLRES